MDARDSIQTTTGGESAGYHLSFWLIRTDKWEGEVVVNLSAGARPHTVIKWLLDLKIFQNCGCQSQVLILDGATKGWW